MTAVRAFENVWNSCTEATGQRCSRRPREGPEAKGEKRGVEKGVRSYLVSESATEVGGVLSGLCCPLCSSQVEPSLLPAMLPVPTSCGASWRSSGSRPAVVVQSSCGFDSSVKDQHGVRRCKKIFSPPLRLSSPGPGGPISFQSFSSERSRFSSYRTVKDTPFSPVCCDARASVASRRSSSRLGRSSFTTLAAKLHSRSAEDSLAGREIVSDCGAGERAQLTISVRFEICDLCSWLSERTERLLW